MFTPKPTVTPLPRIARFDAVRPDTSPVVSSEGVHFRGYHFSLMMIAEMAETQPAQLQLYIYGSTPDGREMEVEPDEFLGNEKATQFWHDMQRCYWERTPLPDAWFETLADLLDAAIAERERAVAWCEAQLAAKAGVQS